MKQFPINTIFFPFIVNFHFLYDLKRYESEYEHRINFPDEKYICKVVYSIPLSKELQEKYQRENVYIIHLDNKDFNCYAACDINDEEVFEFIRNTVK